MIDRGALGEAQLLRFRCIGIRTDGKAKIFEWLDEELVAPPTILSDPLVEERVDQALKQADDIRYVLASTFDRHFRPERDRGGRDEKLVRFKTLRARMLATYWQRLAPYFRVFIGALASEQGQDAVARAWAATLTQVGNRAFDEAATQVGNRADALRARVQAQDGPCRRWPRSKSPSSAA